MQGVASGMKCSLSILLCQLGSFLKGRRTGLGSKNPMPQFHSTGVQRTAQILGLCFRHPPWEPGRAGSPGGAQDRQTRHGEVKEEGVPQAQPRAEDVGSRVNSGGPGMGAQGAHRGGIWEDGDQGGE